MLMNTTVLLDQEPHASGHVVRALLRIEGEAQQAADRTEGKEAHVSIVSRP